MSDAAKKALQDLKDEITCPICQEFFQDPKILPCFHCYCKLCILQLAKGEQPFPCPECRGDTFLPPTGADGFPTAFYINRLKSLLETMETVQGATSSGDRDLSCEHSSYLAQVFLKSVAASYRWKVFFVVTKDLDFFKAFVQRRLNGLVLETSLTIEFSSDEIVFVSSASTDKRWEIQPNYHPCIIKSEVDSYYPGKELPKCEFTATWTGDHAKPYLPQVEFFLLGAKSPRNYCRINFSVDVHTHKDKPILGPDCLCELFETVKGAKEEWRSVGTNIGFSHVELCEIPHTTGLNDDMGYFQELLKRWLNRAPPEYTFPQVKELLIALRKVGMHRSAYDLEHHVSLHN